MKFMRTAVVAGTAAVAGLAVASPALASPVPAVQVPCRVRALARAINGAPDGAELRLASCTYVLARALPEIGTRLTLQGGLASTIERRYGGSTPHYSLLSLGKGGNLTVTNVNFKNGYAAEEGGAVDNEDATSISGSTFTHNTSEYGGAPENDDDVTLSNSTFTSNSSSEYGGAVYTEGDATFHGISLKGNRAYYGGGLYNDDDMTLTGGSFTNNTAAYGGGMYNEDEATVGGTTFQQNTASTAGGGIYQDGTFAHLHSSRLTYNHAPFDESGGIYNDAGTVALTSTVVRFNAVNNCSPALSVPGCTG